ncbi:TetR family transcriptional regulator [Kribbella sandramycini]|uniref:AcrR family transcriptional regulator n=1 Tax=Kribbella sandramycini TaxID=60450 RepID=A0A7Y4L5I4_9ACTN|nr:TetR/AcrR family transcriptional regulator [Kribbella sandramycini]MBB6570683.1 AcrR family transcriptional regulator [Kribbella sandramycini]NOL43827.1 TetR family transcriptional regulator [Kribbella sandramycini]
MADRAAAVRTAMRTVVARNGFHGASMSAVAREAGVATGTAYTYYASKDDVVLAAYSETKAELGAAAIADVDPQLPVDQRFRALWLACYRHLQANPAHAQFLLQVEHSPYRAPAHEAALSNADDPLLTEVGREDIAARLQPLPVDVLYELSLSPAVRLAAGGIELTPAQLDEIADACWRAVSRPDVS